MTRNSYLESTFGRRERWREFYRRARWRKLYTARRAVQQRRRRH